MSLLQRIKEDPKLARAEVVVAAAREVAEVLRSLRKHAGLTQEVLAEKLNVSQARISQVESGKVESLPSYDFVALFAHECGAKAKLQIVGVEATVDKPREPSDIHLKTAAQKSSTLNKNDLILKVAEDAKLTKGEAGEAIEAALANIQKALMQGDDVRLVGFGTFSVGQRAASTDRDPRTGRAIDIPASQNAMFKAGKNFDITRKFSK